MLLVDGALLMGMIMLQRSGAEWVERIIRHHFPRALAITTFQQSIQELYSSWLRLAGASLLHLLGWISAGGGTFFAVRLAEAR